VCVSHISVEAAETSVVVAHVALDLTEGQVHRTDFSGCMASTNRVSHSFEPETILHVHHAVPGTWKIMENHGKSWQNHGKSCLSLGKYMEIPIMNHSMSYSSEDVTFLDHLKGATVEHRG
jgi:hypothetical protein